MRPTGGAAAAVLLVVAGALAGCGGGSNSHGGSPAAQATPSLGGTRFCSQLSKVYSGFEQKATQELGSLTSGTTGTFLQLEVNDFSSLASSAPSSLKAGLTDFSKKLAALDNAVKSANPTAEANAVDAFSASEAKDLSNLGMYEAEHCHVNP